MNLKDVKVKIRKPHRCEFCGDKHEPPTEMKYMVNIHDGDNEIGWRVYCEDWGKIYTSDNRSIDGVIAIKPVYLWYGK